MGGGFGARTLDGSVRPAGTRAPAALPSRSRDTGRAGTKTEGWEYDYDCVSWGTKWPSGVDPGAVIGRYRYPGQAA